MCQTDYMLTGRWTVCGCVLAQVCVLRLMYTIYVMVSIWLPVNGDQSPYAVGQNLYLMVH